MNTFFVRVDMCVFLFEITEITEWRRGVFQGLSALSVKHKNVSLKASKCM
jgi:hypothetical protein